MKGLSDQIIGVPVIEDKNMPEGTYRCLDKEGLPIKEKDIENTPIARILVRDIETFKLSIKYNSDHSE